jgi:hypothetical protein
MRCKNIRKKLSAYVTGDVSDAERALISKHIEICEKCAGELSGIESVIKDISGFDLPHPPDIYFEYFPKRVTSSIPDQSGLETGRKKRILRLSFASGIIVVALFILFFYTSIQKDVTYENLNYNYDTLIYDPLPEVISASEEELIGAALEIGTEEVGELEGVIETYEIWDESYDLSDEEWEEVLHMLEKSFNENGV